MDELVKQVIAKTGISEEQAQQAVQVVLGFVKDKLPAPIASQVDHLVSGSGNLDLGNIGNILGGLFGGEHK